ncbi:rhomboid family protein [Haloferax sp. BAB-2207]|nr:rhomboid family protein [Haloferax sp. BAB-2207]
MGIETFEFWFLFTPGIEPTPAWILSLFAHGTVRHLGVNIVGILVYGLVLERYVARKTYLGVYISTGLLAGLIHINLTDNSGAGASGAIMGIIGFYSIVYLALYRPNGWNDPLENVRYVLAILGPLVIGAQYAVDIYINNGGYAHVAGGIIGILLGLVYARSQVESSVSRTIESARESPFRTALLVLVLAETAVIVYLLIATPENQQPQRQSRLEPRLSWFSSRFGTQTTRDGAPTSSDVNWSWRPNGTTPIPSRFVLTSG